MYTLEFLKDSPEYLIGVVKSIIEAHEKGALTAENAAERIVLNSKEWTKRNGWK